MMKRNMTFFTLVMAVLCLNVNRAIAQDRSYEGTITIVPVRLEQLGETVHIDFDILMKDVKVKTGAWDRPYPAVSFSYHYLRASTGFHQRKERVSGL